VADGKRPAFQFYPGDWKRDAGLQSTSLEARGLWIEMMGLMHDGQPYGHLRFGSSAITPRQLAQMVGAAARRVETLLRELETAGVFSRDDQGVIFSRRMVRDERVRNARAAGGPKSLDNPSVPRPKDTEKDHGKDGGKDTLHPSSVGSLGGSPASASASSSAFASSEEHTVCVSGLKAKGHEPHAFCCRVCVPDFLHRQLLEQLGSSLDNAEERLFEWYEYIVENRMPEIVLEEPPKFWRRWFEADPLIDRSEWRRLVLPAGRTAS
jgi:hypothetical protein